jgi:translation initiation factor IF-2
MTVSSKVRIYDLAKELKLDTKRLIEEVRREGVDVSVPSNSVSKELAEKIRNKYFPKKETAVKRTVKVVKRASLPTPEAPLIEAEEEIHEPEPIIAAPLPEDEPVEAPPPVSTPAPVRPQQPITRLVKKLSPPPVRAEAPVIEEEIPPPPVEEVPEPEPPPVIEEPLPMPEVVTPTNGAEAKTIPVPPSRQVRVLRPTAAALNAGIRPGERAPVPTPPPTITPKERIDRNSRVRERPSLPRAERVGTPGETANYLHSSSRCRTPAFAPSQSPRRQKDGGQGWEIRPWRFHSTAKGPVSRRPHCGPNGDARVRPTERSPSDRRFYR